MTSDEMKAEIDQLRAEWDRLDDHGGNTPKQNEISKQIERLTERLKQLTGEDY